MLIFCPLRVGSQGFVRPPGGPWASKELYFLLGMLGVVPERQRILLVTYLSNLVDFINTIMQNLHLVGSMKQEPTNKA